MHFREVRIARPAARTFAELSSTLAEAGFEIATRDEKARVLIVDRTSRRGWFLGLLVVLTLGLIGQPDSVRVTARVDEDGEEQSIVAIEARQLYGWPGREGHYPHIVSGILAGLLRRLGLGAALG
jgi:hypothetical protein